METHSRHQALTLTAALLFTLIGWAGHMKSEFHYRAEISSTAFIVAAILAGLAVLLFLLSLAKKRG